MAIHNRLFRADGADSEVALSRELVAALDDRQLLWVDLCAASDEERACVGAMLDLDPATLESDPASRARPTLAHFGACFSIRVNPVHFDDDGQVVSQALTLVSGCNYVITEHAQPVAFLDELNERERGETQLGELSAEVFAASLLDWHLTTYFHAVEIVERHVDRAEVAVLGRHLPNGFLKGLVKTRRQVGELRRLLKPHRYVFYGLLRPDFTATGKAQAHFVALTEHFERAEDALESARTLIIGSFELFSTHMAQRTTDSMRVLTFFTVLLGSLGLIAGVLGMNFEVEFFETGLMGFGIAIGSMLAIILGAVVLAKMRRWF